jgi:hypothetical protein
MSTIEHKSTAKASLRNLISSFGTSGTLALLSEVLIEKLPARRGRPTRDEKVSRLVLKTIEGLLDDVVSAEGIAMAAKMKNDE